MIINPQDTLEIKLGDVVDTRQLTYYISYFNGSKNISSTGITNDTNKVIIIPRSKTLEKVVNYVLINNLDTIPQEVVITTNDSSILTVTLEIGVILEYNSGRGWSSSDLNNSHNFLRI